jgi:hypothetical protein
VLSPVFLAESLHLVTHMMASSRTVEAFFLSNIDPLNKKFLKDDDYEG